MGGKHKEFEPEQFNEENAFTQENSNLFAAK